MFFRHRRHWVRVYICRDLTCNTHSLTLPDITIRPVLSFLCFVACLGLAAVQTNNGVLLLELQQAKALITELRSAAQLTHAEGDAQAAGKKVDAAGGEVLAASNKAQAVQTIHTTELTALQSKHTTELAAVRSTHVLELAVLQSNHSTKLTALTTDLAKRMKELSESKELLTVQTTTIASMEKEMFQLKLREHTFETKLQTVTEQASRDELLSAKLNKSFHEKEKVLLSQNPDHTRHSQQMMNKQLESANASQQGFLSGLMHMFSHSQQPAVHFSGRQDSRSHHHPGSYHTQQHSGSFHNNQQHTGPYHNNAQHHPGQMHSPEPGGRQGSISHIAQGSLSNTMLLSHSTASNSSSSSTSSADTPTNSRLE